MSAEFAKMQYSPKSRISLHQLKPLLLLDVALFLGCEISWANESAASYAATSVLDAENVRDDVDDRASQAGDEGRAAHAASPVFNKKGVSPGK